MLPKRTRNRRCRRGVVYVLALMALAVLTSLGAVLATSVDLSAQKSDNYRHSTDARLAAESGLAFMLLVLRDLQLPADTSQDQLLSNLYAALSARMNGTENLGSASISLADGVISVPQIQAGNLRFSSTLALVQDGGVTRVLLTVAGGCEDSAAVRRVRLALDLSPRRSAIFDYGVASRGRISLKGNSVVTGMSRPEEAAVLSLRAAAPGIEVSGSATVGGELYVVGDSEDYVELGSGGGYTVAGCGDRETILDEHVNLNVVPPAFPQLDTALLIELAVNTADASTRYSGSDLVYENMRFPAGTNPTFHNDAVINGVMYVESPNVVSFRGGVTINGVIVTEELPGADLEECVIEFRGHVTAPGVGALPDEQAYAVVKQHSGTVVLAPGFQVDMRGNVGTINGVIAADKLTFRGNASVSGDLAGSILGLQDRDLLMQGSTDIRIHRLADAVAPAGFRHPLGLSPVPASYSEPAGQ